MHFHVKVFCTIAVVSSLVFPGPLYGFEEELKTLSLKLASEISASGKTKIAVVDFSDTRGNVTELGRFLAEEVSAALLDTGQGLEVIDRTQIKIILRENKLAETGVIDQNTAMKLGQITGVEALITGTITPFGDTVRVTVKVLDAATARLVASARGNIARTEAIQQLLTSGLAGPSGEALSRGSSRSRSRSRTGGVPGQTVKEFFFEVDRCEIKGSDLVCAFFVTNNAGDRALTISRGSRVFSGSGVEYLASQTALGSQKSTSSTRIGLVSGIRTRGALYFEGVSSSLERIAVLEIGCYANNVGNFKAQFRDISP